MKKNLPVVFEAVYSQDEPVLIQEYLRQEARMSGRSLRQYFFKGLVEVNRRKAHSAAKLKAGDHIRVFQPKESASPLTPEALPIEIIYENDQLLVINKPALLPVHPSGSISRGTLANRVAYYYQTRQLPVKVRPVNRLDHGTSGLIIFAKTAASQEKLSQAIQSHKIQRIYYAIVHGILAQDEGIIDLPILQQPGNRRVDPQGQPAATRFKVIRRYSKATLLELALETGRTHQIRIHLSHIGHPIIGDKTYGKPSSSLNHPALHAGKLIFDPAVYNIPELTAPLPDDWQGLFDSLENT